MFEVGDKVMYTRNFCRSVGLFASNDPLVHRTRGGTVTELRPFGKDRNIVVLTDADGSVRKMEVER